MLTQFAHFALYITDVNGEQRGEFLLLVTVKSNAALMKKDWFLNHLCMSLFLLLVHICPTLLNFFLFRFPTMHF